LPNKTIYIRSADLPLWERAQQELGESVSSVFVEYLKERLEKERLETKAKRPKKEKLDLVKAMDALLAEINSIHNLDIERHPAWSPIILDANTDNIGYKLHQKRANPDRIMSLIVHPFDFEKDGQLNATTKNRIMVAVEKFWDGKCGDRHMFVDAAT
jgi:hypothetical protein